jgi:hypothetical protein
MRDWLIRLLGGAIPAEVEFLRGRIRENEHLTEAILELRGLLVKFGASEQPSQPIEVSKSVIKTVSEPWTIRRRRLEFEDLRKVKDEKSQAS